MEPPKIATATAAQDGDSNIGELFAAFESAPTVDPKTMNAINFAIAALPGDRASRAKEYFDSILRIKELRMQDALRSFFGLSSLGSNAVGSKEQKASPVEEPADDGKGKKRKGPADEDKAKLKKAHAAYKKMLQVSLLLGRESTWSAEAKSQAMPCFVRLLIDSLIFFDF